MTAAASPPDTILVMRSPGETRAALLAGDRVVEVVHRRDGTLVAGAACSGRVVGHAAGFAFVDIGDVLPGVLKTKTPLVEGSVLPVRIVVPPRADKGAELVRAVAEAPPPEPAAVWLSHYGAAITDILVSPVSELRRLKKILPDAPVVDGGKDPFAHHDVDAAIEAALEPVVPLPDGGRLIIEATAAAICIDIDAGSSSPVTANAAAIAVIAQALRLRNLAGHILIDVIPAGRGAGRTFAAALTSALADDPANPVVAGVTPLGMVELTRRREGLSLAETMSDPVTEAAYAALRKAVQTAAQAGAAKIRIAGSPDLIARLQGKLRPALEEACTSGLCTIELTTKPAWPAARTEVTPV